MKVKYLLISSALLYALPTHADIKTTLEALAVQFNALSTALKQGKPYREEAEDPYKKAATIPTVTSLKALVDLWGDGRIRGLGYDKDFIAAVNRLLNISIGESLAKQFLYALGEPTNDAQAIAVFIMQNMNIIGNEKAISAIDAFFKNRFKTSFKDTPAYTGAIDPSKGTGGKGYTGGGGESGAPDTNKDAIIAAASKAQNVKDLIGVWQMCNAAYQRFTLPGAKEAIVPEVTQAIERVLGLKDRNANEYDGLFTALTNQHTPVGFKAQTVLNFIDNDVNNLNKERYLQGMDTYFYSIGNYDSLFDTEAYKKAKQAADKKSGGGSSFNLTEPANFDSDSQSGKYFNLIHDNIEAQADPLVAYKYMMEGDALSRPNKFEGTPYGQHIAQFIAQKFKIDQNDLVEAYNAVADHTGYFESNYNDKFFSTMESLKNSKPHVFKIIANVVNNRGVGSYAELKDRFDRKKALVVWYDNNVKGKDISDAAKAIVDTYKHTEKKFDTVAFNVIADLFEEQFNKTVDAAWKEISRAKETEELNAWFDANVKVIKASDEGIQAAIQAIQSKYGGSTGIPQLINERFKNEISAGKRSVEDEEKYQRTLQNKKIMPTGDKLEKIVAQMIVKIQDTTQPNIFERLHNAEDVITSENHLDPDLVDNFFDNHQFVAALFLDFLDRNKTAQDKAVQKDIVGISRLLDAYKIVRDPDNKDKIDRIKKALPDSDRWSEKEGAIPALKEYINEHSHSY
ncbi:MAG: hypothetical protein WCE21_02310 [Candidatus Babeliales bacterium]